MSDPRRSRKVGIERRSSAIERAGDEDKLAYIVPAKVKGRIVREMGDVPLTFAVDPEDAEACSEKALGEMGAEESDGSRDNSGFFIGNSVGLKILRPIPK
jgi:hypothetical protein